MVSIFCPLWTAMVSIVGEITGRLSLIASRSDRWVAERSTTFITRTMLKGGHCSIGNGAAGEENRIAVRRPCRGDVIAALWLTLQKRRRFFGIDLQLVDLESASLGVGKGVQKRLAVGAPGQVDPRFLSKSYFESVTGTSGADENQLTLLVRSIASKGDPSVVVSTRTSPSVSAPNSAS